MTTKTIEPDETELPDVEGQLTLTSEQQLSFDNLTFIGSDDLLDSF
jgi:hypothetical protein